MNSRRTPAFRAAFADLPESARQQARDAYRLFLQNPNHPGLQFKPIGASIYSVRIGLHYRALGYLQGDTVHKKCNGLRSLHMNTSCGVN